MWADILTFGCLILIILFALIFFVPWALTPREFKCQEVCGRYINLEADHACFCLVDPERNLWQKRIP